jgi:hypothetical protein
VHSAAKITVFPRSVTGPCSTPNRAPGRSHPTRGSTPARYAASPPWVTPTPFGAPVDPDVYITYASCPRRTGRPASTGSWVPPDAAAISSGRTTATAPAPASTASIRAAGQAGSTGRYAAPASQHPSIAVIISAPRGRLSPTTCSGPDPKAPSRDASRPARAISSP